MPAAELDIIVEKGSKFYKKLRWKDSEGVGIPLTGFSARMQIRKKADAATTLVSLNSPTDIVLEAGSVKGLIEIKIGATVTATLPSTSAVYDLEIVNDSDADDVRRLVAGKVTISKEVTR